jgi:hypothetical protein
MLLLARCSRNACSIAHYPLPMNYKLIRTLALLPTAALFAALPATHASETTARIDSSASEIKGDAAKLQLKQIDAQIDLLDDAVDNAPTATEKAAAKERLNLLKERRSELRKTYVRSRFDELESDVRAESNRIGSWSKKTYKRDPVATAGRDVDRATDRTYATGAVAAAADVEAYKLRPTDTDKNEAKAALEALDHRIDELAKRADNMPKGADRDIAKRRVKALDKRKDELKSDFNKERFNALVDEVQAEGRDLRH